MLRFCLGLLLVAAAWGQEGGDDRLRFEVASVKPSAKQGMVTRMVGGPGTGDPGRFRAANAELGMLVFRAYGLQHENQLELKGPAWMHTTQFDVVANVPPGTTVDQLRKMLQNLLAERFHLQVHHVTRVEPVYELTGAKNGPKLKPAAEGSGTDDFVPGSGPRQADRDNFPVLPPGRPNVACGHLPQGSYCTFRMVTMGMLVQRLSLPNFVGRPVVDKTGLTGPYDFALFYNSMINPPANSDNNAPSIEKAVQEQLGLQLAPSKASIEVLVIDHAEAPKDN
jgi:uncharacterized protein (TIGR03435 family)